ncbi:hypothetical protein MPSI1_003410 [Malassezia psittaci]|uniref:Branchpoint-bridging protein n=1 Tax=Malassezia psittaci TaxID=1821823 RepID=A0AAF0FDF8_9BASI|nr:hypothetical protein MPSI1_003410 [Malassezia psittaci]
MNAQPLGNTRRWGSAEGGNRSGHATSNYDMPKRRFDDEPARYSNDAHDNGAGGYGSRKRRSRWGGAAERTDGAPAAISGQVSAQELDRYAIQVRLDEINRKLRVGDVVPPERERSPSPPPTYDVHGRRNNTRDMRYRKKLEDERIRLVERQMKIDPTFRPPAEYQAAKRSMRPTEKVYLPVREFPEINFFGLLVGPRGNTLKKMEGQSGAKIHIRGKGSVKHGKGAGTGGAEDEDMHCIVTADTDRQVKHCIKLINEVVSTAASTPETQNDHKRSQLRELAVLNGTLRDDENQVCQNCGEKGHRKFECTNDRNWGNGIAGGIVCHRCGGQGHVARDCIVTRDAFGMPGEIDSEYASLMAELGEDAYAPRIGSSMPLLNEKGEKIPPWRDPNVWNTPSASGDRPAYSDPNTDAAWGDQTYDPASDAYAQQSGEQRDYSAEWAAYYAAQAAAQNAQQDGEPVRDYSKEWEEYYRQQALLQGQPESQANHA